MTFNNKQEPPCQMVTTELYHKETNSRETAKNNGSVFVSNDLNQCS